MQKNTLIATILITLVVGLSVGYQVGINKTITTKDMENIPMSHMMIDMSTELRGKNGDDFDKAFLSEMIIHHQGAVEMAQLAITNTKHKEIKDLASVIIEAQKREIDEMKVWQKSWYK